MITMRFAKRAASAQQEFRANVQQVEEWKKNLHNDSCVSFVTGYRTVASSEEGKHGCEETSAQCTADGAWAATDEGETVTLPCTDDQTELGKYHMLKCACTPEVHEHLCGLCVHNCKYFDRCKHVQCCFESLLRQCHSPRRKAEAQVQRRRHMVDN